MNNIVAFSPAHAGEVAEQVLIRGDLASLTHAERARYYVRICESLGLNPMTKPFEYLTLNNKLTLYALKGCTDQLRRLHGVSVTKLTETERDGVYIVTAFVQDREGRTDAGKGAVNIANLRGDALANAIMKAETKAKRRATLSLCGLGFLDETEIETIPAHVKAPQTAMEALSPPEATPALPAPEASPEAPEPPKTVAARRKPDPGRFADDRYERIIRADRDQRRPKPKPTFDERNPPPIEALPQW